METGLRRSTLAAALLAVAAAWIFLPLAAAAETSGRFSGAKVNRGSVEYKLESGRRLLTLSEDFEKPMTPDPHWQVVDSKGEVHLLDRLDVKGDRFKRQIELPAHVPDVARVQIWCAFAESLLGEASFASPVE